MTCLRVLNERNRHLIVLLALLFSGVAFAQPYCDVLLRPAFTATTAGNAVTFQNVSGSLVGDVSESWNYGDGSAPDTFAYTIYDNPGTYSVCLTISTQDTTCSSTYCRDVVVPENDCNGTWDASFQTVPLNINSLSFTDNSNAQQPDSRSWGFGDLTPTSSEESPNHTWLLPGPHYTHLTRTQNDCVTTHSDWVTVDGNASTCDQDLFVNFASYDNSGEVYFEPETLTSSTYPVLLLWSFGDGQADTAFTTTHTYAEPGSYQVCLFVGALYTSTFDSCFAFVCRTIDIGTSLVGIPGSDRSTFNAWPVPFQRTLHIRAPSITGECTIELTDATGRRVHRAQQHATQQMDLLLPELPSGMYVLELTSASERQRLLLVRE